jgi:hypothetical protein
LKDQPLPLLEDAVNLLRQAPLATFLCHWIGSLPFALFLLLYWNDATNPRTPNSTCALEALVLALLLVWMNCWRAVYAGRLQNQLSGAADTPWTGSRIWRLAAVQSFIGATKLPMMAIALLVMFPLAATVAFYRNTAVLSSRDDLDPRQILSRARELAGRQAAQSWTLLPVLTFLWLLVALNLAIFLGVLPQIVRILTGYESTFSRSRDYFVLNPLFAILVIAVSWIAFDPFVQAVYCVRCFRGESMETGEDLRAGLRLLRSPVLLMLLLLFMAVGVNSSAAVSPADLEHSVQQTIQAHEYDWRLPPPPVSAAKSPWLMRMVDRMIEGVRSATRAVGNGVERFLRWLFGDRFPQPQPGAPPSSGLNSTVSLLLLAVILVAAWLSWRKLRSPRVRRTVSATAGPEPVRLDAEDLTPDRLPEESWIELAERSLRENNLRLALRAFYLANLAWLGRRGFISIHPGKTNREYEAELRRRARAHAEARGLFTANIAAFERAWYGMYEVTGDDIVQFRGRVSEMKKMDEVKEAAA